MIWGKNTNLFQFTFSVAQNDKATKRIEVDQKNKPSDDHWLVLNTHFLQQNQTVSRPFLSKHCISLSAANCLMKAKTKNKFGC